jgi:hypothetical protein
MDAAVRDQLQVCCSVFKGCSGTMCVVLGSCSAAITHQHQDYCSAIPVAALHVALAAAPVAIAKSPQESAESSGRRMYGRQQLLPVPTAGSAGHVLLCVLRTTHRHMLISVSAAMWRVL